MVPMSSHREMEKQNNTGEKQRYGKVAIIIPVYEEVNVIEKSVQNFSGFAKNGINIYYVTTEKEHGKHTTKNVLREIIKRKKFEQNIHIIEYPYNTGVMAHQLNYAIEQFEPNTICFVYNVDSVIDIRTIDYVIDNIEVLDNGVFQQYSYSERTSDSRIINSAILWQNRWMFAFELPKTIRSKGTVKLLNFNYVIGHGLVFSREMYDNFEGFSESDINEDNVLGYVLSIKNIPVYHIPYLEKVDFAYSTPVYLLQQETWFNGPLYAYKYFTDLCKKLENNKIKWRAFITASLNFRAAINWLPFPITCIILLIWTGLTSRYGMFLLLLALIEVYVRAINEVSELCIKKITGKQFKSRNIISCQCLFWMFVHTIGPIRTLWKIIAGKNNQENKKKPQKSKMF